MDHENLLQNTPSVHSSHHDNEILPPTADPNTPVTVVHTQHDNGKDITTQYTFQYSRLAGTSSRFVNLGAAVTIIDGQYILTIPSNLAPWQAVRLVLTYLHENQTPVSMTRVPKCGFFDKLIPFELGMTWNVFDHGMDIVTVAEMYKVCNWLGIKEPFSSSKLHDRLMEYFGYTKPKGLNLKTAAAILACTNDEDTSNSREMAMYPICQKLAGSIKATGKLDEEMMFKRELTKIGSKDLYEIYNAHIERIVGGMAGTDQL